MTKRKVKKLIRKADKMSIAQAIFNYWKLGERPQIQFPYNNLGNYPLTTGKIGV